MTDGGVKKRAKILTGIDQKMVNKENLLLKTKEAILSEMIEENKDVSDVTKKIILKEIAENVYMYYEEDIDENVNIRQKIKPIILKVILK